MKLSIYLMNAGAWRPQARHDWIADLRNSAAASESSFLACDAACADLVLAVACPGCGPPNPAWRALMRARTSNCFLYSTEDDPFPFVPGIYPSIPHYMTNAGRSRSGPYLSVLRSHDLDSMPPIESAKWLFSFVGRTDTAPVRERLIALRNHRGLIIDTAPAAGGMHDSQARVEDFRGRFVASIGHSKFVLCPRGFGVSSLRLFEVLRAGRVPVILSDSWVPPEGPQWSAFAVRVAEKDVACIPELLSRLEASAESRGQLARQAWESHFALDRIFDWIVGQCMSMKLRRRLPAQISNWLAVGRLADPRCYPKVTSRAISRILDWSRVGRLFLALARRLREQQTKSDT